MTNSYSKFKLLFLVFIAFLAACVNKNDVQKKETIIKMVDFIKLDKMDSLKYYFAFEMSYDSDRLFSTLALADSFIKKSNVKIIADSIKCRDSSYVLTEKLYMYDYTLPFYHDKQYLGSVNIGFHGNQNNIPILIDAIPYVDEDELVNDLNKIMAEGMDDSLSVADSNNMKPIKAK